jgi:PilZ domain
MKSVNRLEHRWGERHEVNFPIRLDAGTALKGAKGRVRNLSLSGAFVTSDCDWRLNTLIEVGIKLPSPSSRTTIVRAIVSRKLKDGVGIEWYEFAPKVIKDLLRLGAGSSHR